MFYAKSTGGFYALEIHGENIPADAVEISQEVYDALLVGQSEGKMITSNKHGAPVLVDQPAQPAVTIDPVQKLKDFIVANPDVAALLGGALPVEGTQVQSPAIKG